MSINRFDCESVVLNIDRRPIEKTTESKKHYIFKNDDMEVPISKLTGLIDKYCEDICFLYKNKH